MKPDTWVWLGVTACVALALGGALAAAGCGASLRAAAARSDADEASQKPADPPGESGAMLWSENCGRCHNLRSPSEFSDAQWAVAVHHMRLRVPLTGEDQKAILAFLQSAN